MFAVVHILFIHTFVVKTFGQQTKIIYGPNVLGPQPKIWKPLQFFFWGVLGHKFSLAHMRTRVIPQFVQVAVTCHQRVV